MSKLQAALRWAARGFRVFALRPNSKDPLDIAWTTHATNDPERIRAWWTDPVTGHERDYNIGSLTNGLVVPDIDVKNGKPGLANHARLGFDWDTLTVGTPSGGYHCVYQGLDRIVGGSPLAEGIDVRSHNGYVVAPGSTIDGVEYKVVLDLPVAPFPEHLRHLLKAPRARREAAQTADVELDTPEAIEIAAHWLTREAPVAIEGRNGDDTTYKVACRLHDFGLSEDAAVNLMLDEYNPRCEPPWPGDDMRAKVENAYRYASGTQGAANPAIVFAGVEFVPPPAPLLEAVNGVKIDGIWQFGNMMRREEMTDRPFVLGDILVSQVVTTLIGAGGSGKSLLCLVIAAHVVTGRTFLGHEVKRRGRVLIYEAEDDVQEMSRRLHAICAVYGLPEDEVRAGISLNSDNVFYGGPPAEEPVPGLMLVANRPLRRNVAQLAALVQAASAPDVVLVIVGPLSDVHGAAESDNPEMNYVMGALRAVARQADVAVLVPHHTPKPQAGAASGAGNQDAGRGATAIANKARVVLTLFRATEDDCAEIGVPASQKKSYARLDGAKATFSAAAAETWWLRWQSAAIATGDSVGVLVPHDAKAAATGSAEDLARILRDRMLRMGRASLTITESGAALQDADPAAAKQDARAVRSRIERVLAQPIAVDGATLRIVRSAERGQTVLTIVMS